MTIYYWIWYLYYWISLTIINHLLFINHLLSYWVNQLFLWLKPPEKPWIIRLHPHQFQPRLGQTPKSRRAARAVLGGQKGMVVTSLQSVLYIYIYDIYIYEIYIYILYIYIWIYIYILVYIHTVYIYINLYNHVYCVSIDLDMFICVFVASIHVWMRLLVCLLDYVWCIALICSYH